MLVLVTCPCPGGGMAQSWPSVAIAKAQKSGQNETAVWSLLFCFGHKLHIDIDTPAEELKFFPPRNKSAPLNGDLVTPRAQDKRCRRPPVRTSIDVDVCFRWSRGNVDQSGLCSVPGKRRIIRLPWGYRSTVNRRLRLCRWRLYA